MVNMTIGIYAAIFYGILLIVGLMGGDDEVMSPRMRKHIDNQQNREKKKDTL